MNYTAGNYVRKFFRMNFLSCYNGINKREVDALVYQIGDKLAKKYGIKQILSGNVDDILFKLLEKYIKNNKSDLWAKHVNLRNYVIKYICSNVNISYNEETLHYITERVSNSLISSFDYNDLMKGKADELILSTYYKCFDKLCQRIYNYVRGYIIKNAVPINEINEIKISKNIVEEIMNTNKYNAIDLLMGRYDDMIKHHIIDYRINVEKTKPDSVQYIYRYILKEYDDGLEFDEIMEYAIYIDDYLRTNKGLIAKDIISHKYDDDIGRLYRRKYMRDNSVQIEEERRRVKHDKRKRKMQKNVATLLIFATLAGLLGTTAYHVGKGVTDVVEETSSDMRYNYVSSQMSGDRYDSLFTKYSDNYVNNIQFVIEDYNNYSSYGENYGYLGFYEAYKHTRKDSLAIMDSMLKEIDSKLSSDKYDSNLNIDTYYFLEFAYNRLVEMGCEEIKDEKYINAVNEYRRASWYNDDENKTTMDYIHENNRKLEDTIEEIMEMYHKYSSMYYKELHEIYNPTEKNGRSII